MLVQVPQSRFDDEWMEYPFWDRLNWLRFLGLDLDAPSPDANTIWLFREKRTEGGALQALLIAFVRETKQRGDMAMAGQIVDTTWWQRPSNATLGQRSMRPRGAERSGDLAR